MNEPILPPDTSILIDEQVLIESIKITLDAKKAIAAVNERVRQANKIIEQALDRVARKLIEYPLAFDQMDDVNVNYADFTLEQYNAETIKFTYNLKDVDVMVVAYTWDLYEGSCEKEIMSFPLSFVHRTDWLAYLEVWVEVATLKTEREKQKEQEEQVKIEMALLRILLAKHQDKL